MKFLIASPDAVIADVCAMPFPYASLRMTE